ncbi:sigma 54-interacting transcriptional regulator [Planctomicrobium sp. SH664]|uniref:sigma 54-interacting transcriptional regulator n=1 Tax=Planctomicrobium sp. SH664 TaxID=3448125 RepID=UPI003F5BF15B
MFQKWSITALATFAVLYGLVVLWFVPTQLTLPLGALLVNNDRSPSPGVEISDVRSLKGCLGPTPGVGDHIISAAGRPIRNFTDWSELHYQLRNWKIDPAAQIEAGQDPSEKNPATQLPVVQKPDQTRYVQVWFLRPGEQIPHVSWIQLVEQPTFGVSITLLWFVLQLCVVAVVGVAYWNRPFDQPLRTFFALSSVTMIAFVGGSHWWIVASCPQLILPFVISSIMLPAVLLHFFVVYPYPSPVYQWSRSLSLAVIYIPAALAATVVGSLILLASFLSSDSGPGPFAMTLDRLAGEFVCRLLPLLRQVVFCIFAMALLYFGASLLVIYRSMRGARNPLERNQVRSIFLAAIFATIPIGYTIYLAFADRVGFALGSARLPMFLASLGFMLAYAIGIARYKLMLIDQVVTRGVWYYSASAGLAVIFASLIAVGAMNAMTQDLSLFGRSVPLILVLVTSVLVLIWGRDAIQRVLDRHFFSEKYQLDKALQRMNRVISNVVEPEAISDSLLNSCQEVLHVDQAALYLRKKNGFEFRMSTAAGRARFPLQIVLDPDAFELLSEESVVQRFMHGHAAAQSLLRQLHAEVVHGLEMQGHLSGLLVLGPKPNHSPFSAEDLAFASALARTTAVALHCATVQQDVARLNQDLQLKIDKIDDQQRQLAALHNELSTLSKLPGTTPSNDEFHRGEIKGHSPAITHVLGTIRKVAGSTSSVLIRGESGTGKELLAKAIHENSTRSHKPLISVHCAALSPTLLESELFGHVKGAFTDARQDKIGRFQMADGGTLFLDEIGDISLDVQVKLLRVLQERMFEPVGSGTPVAVDVRIVAATHRNLEQLIAEGLFREDLFYRLNVISVTLPPLRERREDIYELTLHLLRRSSEKCGKNVLRIDDTALKALQDYHWPGNIRELQNVIERAVVMAEEETMRLADLPVEIRHPQLSVSQPMPSDNLRPAIYEMPGARSTQIALRRKTISAGSDEKAMLESALASCQGNKAEAARLLGIPRSTFFSKLKKHGLG